MKLEDVDLALSLKNSISLVEEEIKDIERSECISSNISLYYTNKSGSGSRVEVSSRYLNFDQIKLQMLTCLRNELKDLKSKLERL